MFEHFKNKIVTIEGADGTGKDTICNLLQEKLPNSVIVRFPNRANPSGQVIDAILKKQKPMEPLSFQALQVINKIETLKHIERSSVICNPDYFIFCRYYQSAYVYGMNDGIPLEYSQDINSVLPESWLTIILHGKNYGKHEEYYEQDDVQNKISQSYLDLAKKFGWTKIINHHTPDEIVSMILDAISRRQEES